MPHRTALVVLLLSLNLPAHKLQSQTSAQAPWFQQIQKQRLALLKSIDCHRESVSPPEPGLGPLWGCYNASESVKLFINGHARLPYSIKDIKLLALAEPGKKPDVPGEIWARIVGESFMANRAEEIAGIFAECGDKPVEFDSAQYSINISCHKGPEANEHSLIATPSVAD